MKLRRAGLYHRSGSKCVGAWTGTNWDGSKFRAPIPLGQYDVRLGGKTCYSSVLLLFILRYRIAFHVGTKAIRYSVEVAFCIASGGFLSGIRVLPSLLSVGIVFNTMKNFYGMQRVYPYTANKSTQSIDAITCFRFFLDFTSLSWE